MDLANVDYNLWIAFTLENFALVMLAIAIVFGIIDWIIQKMLHHHGGAVVFYRWIALLALGFTAIYMFIMHVFYPEMTAKAIGWADSPFQYAMAAADFGFGVIAILSFRASYGFRLATVIGNTLWLWGNATVQIYEMALKNNFALGNTSSWLWMDILIPLLLIICIAKMPKNASAAS